MSQPGVQRQSALLVRHLCQVRQAAQRPAHCDSKLQVSSVLAACSNRCPGIQHTSQHSKTGKMKFTINGFIQDIMSGIHEKVRDVCYNLRILTYINVRNQILKNIVLVSSQHAYQQPQDCQEGRWGCQLSLIPHFFNIYPLSIIFCPIYHLPSIFP